MAEALRDQAGAGAGRTLIASVTRLRLRGWRFVPAFLYRAFRSQRQAERSDGFLGGYVAMAARRAFWTVTLWRDVEAMRAYRRAGAHLAAMPKLLVWCDEAAVATLADVEVLPEPDEAARRLAAEGRLSKVRHPSPAHASGAVFPDGAVPRATQRLKPRGR